MAVINLLPTVATENLTLARIQERFEQPLQQLTTTPWGNGVLITGIALASAAGNQQLVIRHGLGRKATGAVIWNCTIQVYGPWGLMMLDNNNCSVNVNLPNAATVPGLLDMWVG